MESKWREWDHAEIVLWFKYKTINKNTDNINWEEIICDSQHNPAYPANSRWSGYVGLAAIIYECNTHHPICMPVCDCGANSGYQDCNAKGVWSGMISMNVWCQRNCNIIPEIQDTKHQDCDSHCECS